MDEARLKELKNYIMSNLLTFQIAEVTWDENTAYQMVASNDRQLDKALQVLAYGTNQKAIFSRITEEGKK